MTSMAYLAMKKEAERLGLPQVYAGDLHVHDKKRVSECGREPFAWCLYACGTHLICPEDKFQRGAQRFSPAEAYVDCIERVFPAPLYWYWWDGARLREVKAARVRELLKDARGGGGPRAS